MIEGLSRSFAAVTVAVGLLSAATPAGAEVVDTFEAVCVATDARFDAVSEAAFGLGWKVAPPRPSPTPPGPGDRERVFVHPATEGQEEIMASSFTPKTPQGVDSVFSTCTMTFAAPAGDLHQRLGERLGRPGTLNNKGFHVWMYSRQNGALVHETGLFNADQDKIRAAWALRSVYTVMLIPEPDGSASVVMIAARRPDER